MGVTPLLSSSVFLPAKILPLLLFFSSIFLLNISLTPSLSSFFPLSSSFLLSFSLPPYLFIFPFLSLPAPLRRVAIGGVRHTRPSVIESANEGVHTVKTIEIPSIVQQL